LYDLLAVYQIQIKSHTCSWSRAQVCCGANHGRY